MTLAQVIKQTWSVKNQAKDLVEWVVGGGVEAMWTVVKKASMLGCYQHDTLGWSFLKDLKRVASASLEPAVEYPAMVPHFALSG